MHKAPCLKVKIETLEKNETINLPNYYSKRTQTNKMRESSKDYDNRK